MTTRRSDTVMQNLDKIGNMSLDIAIRMDKDAIGPVWLRNEVRLIEEIVQATKRTLSKEREGGVHAPPKTG